MKLADMAVEIVDRWVAEDVDSNEMVMRTMIGGGMPTEDMRMVWKRSGIHRESQVQDAVHEELVERHLV